MEHHRKEFQEITEVQTPDPSTAVGQDYALVIGVNDYPKARPLRGAIADAMAFARWLVADDGGSVPARNVHRILSTPDPLAPLGVEINDALETILECAQTSGGRRFYFYFSGHGCVGDRASDVSLCLANWSELRRRAALSSDAWLDVVVRSGAFAEVVFFLDCCRVWAIRAVGLPPHIDFSRPIERDEPTRVFLGYATELQRTALEAGATEREVRGVFTECLLKGLAGLAPDAMGRVTASSLKAYLEEVVPYQATKLGFRQRAEVVNALSSHSTFRQTRFDGVKFSKILPSAANSAGTDPAINKGVVTLHSPRSIAVLAALHGDFGDGTEAQSSPFPGRDFPVQSRRRSDLKSSDPASARRMPLVLDPSASEQADQRNTDLERALPLLVSGTLPLPTDLHIDSLVPASGAIVGPSLRAYAIGRDVLIPAADRAPVSRRTWVPPKNISTSGQSRSTPVPAPMPRRERSLQYDLLYAWLSLYRDNLYAQLKEIEAEWRHTLQSPSQMRKYRAEDWSYIFVGIFDGGSSDAEWYMHDHTRTRPIDAEIAWTIRKRGTVTMRPAPAGTFLLGRNGRREYVFRAYPNFSTQVVIASNPGCPDDINMLLSLVPAEIPAAKPPAPEKLIAIAKGLNALNDTSSEVPEEIERILKGHLFANPVLGFLAGYLLGKRNRPDDATLLDKIANQLESLLGLCPDVYALRLRAALRRKSDFPVHPCTEPPVFREGLLAFVEASHLAPEIIVPGSLLEHACVHRLVDSPFSCWHSESRHTSIAEDWLAVAIAEACIDNPTLLSQTLAKTLGVPPSAVEARRHSDAAEYARRLQQADKMSQKTRTLPRTTRFEYLPEIVASQDVLASTHWPPEVRHLLNVLPKSRTIEELIDQCNQPASTTMLHVRDLVLAGIVELTCY